MQYKTPPNDIHLSLNNGESDFYARYDAGAGGYHCEMRLFAEPLQWFVIGSQLSVSVLLAIPYEGSKIPAIGAQPLAFFDDWIEELLREVGLTVNQMTPAN